MSDNPSKYTLAPDNMAWRTYLMLQILELLVRFKGSGLRLEEWAADTPDHPRIRFYTITGAISGTEHAFKGSFRLTDLSGGPPEVLWVKGWCQVVTTGHSSQSVLLQRLVSKVEPDANGEVPGFNWTMGDRQISGEIIATWKPWEEKPEDPPTL